MRVLIAQINPIVGDLEGNSKKIIAAIEHGKKQRAELVLLPELALSGYPPDDLLLLPHFLHAVDSYVEKIVASTRGIAAIFGMPKRNPRAKEKSLCNSAAIINDGTLIGVQDKSLLPTYDVFDERRYFEPAAKTFAWEVRGKKVGVTICEDIWQHSAMVKHTDYLHDPVLDLEQQSPDFVVNLSASPFHLKKSTERIAVCSGVAKTLRCPVLLCNQVGGNDSLIFDGSSLYVDAFGRLIRYGKMFEEDEFLVDLDAEPVPCLREVNEMEALHGALMLGLRDYFGKLGLKTACIGISGGIDSAVVACIAADALGKKNVLGLIMPSRYTAASSIQDAEQLVRNLGIKAETISIEEPFKTYLNLVEPSFKGKPYDVTEENLQARIRGTILMAFSNKFGHIVLSTGNKSELAMGYATLYGDMCGGLGVISDVTKMQVYELARWINRKKEVIPKNILTKPPSAELREGQKDTDALPEYAIVDNVLRAYVEEHHSPEEIAKYFDYPLDLVLELVRRIHRNEYKRRQGAPGLRVSPRAFSVGRRFPIVHRWV